MSGTRRVPLARRPAVQITAEAVRLFEATLTKQALTSDERLLLARVYDANHDEIKANREMRVLLALHRDEPRFLAYQIQSLLKRGDGAAAATYLKALELLEPSSERTLRLNAQYQNLQAGN